MSSQMIRFANDGIFVIYEDEERKFGIIGDGFTTTTNQGVATKISQIEEKPNFTGLCKCEYCDVVNNKSYGMCDYCGAPLPGLAPITQMEWFN